MTFRDATTKINEFRNLLGGQNEKGFEIDFIIPVPTNKTKQVDFLREFLRTLDLNKSIAPYQNEDLEIWALEIKHYKESGVLFYEKLS